MILCVFYSLNKLYRALWVKICVIHLFTIWLCKVLLGNIGFFFHRCMSFSMFLNKSTAALPCCCHESSVCVCVESIIKKKYIYPLPQQLLKCLMFFHIFLKTLSCSGREVCIELNVILDVIFFFSLKPYYTNH